MLPRDVECPHCGAKVDHGCHSAKQPAWSARTHRARWKAIGIQKPTSEQWHADVDDGTRRDEEFRRAFFARWREES